MTRHRLQRRWSPWLWLLVPLVLLIALLAVLGLRGSAAERTDAAPPMITANPVVPSTLPAPGTTLSAEPDDAFFGDGAFNVGVDIRPGTYRTEGPADGREICTWKRLRNADNPSDATIADGQSRGPVTVTIKRSDVVFETSGCAQWRLQ